MDCATCGACCRQAFDSVPVVPTDTRTLENQTRLVVVHADGWCDLRREPSPECPGTRCAALIGDGGDARPYRCAIYADRPGACRDLARNSDNCLFARRRISLSADPNSDVAGVERRK